MFTRKSLLIAALLFGSTMPTYAQTAGDDFKKMVNDHMSTVCPKIDDRSDRAVCEMRHHLVRMRVVNAEAMAAVANLHRNLGKTKEADEIRANMITSLREAGADLDKLRADYRK
jgi:hypothetical protein